MPVKSTFSLPQSYSCNRLRGAGEKMQRRVAGEQSNLGAKLASAEEVVIVDGEAMGLVADVLEETQGG